jgi:hypothetical protein
MRIIGQNTIPFCNSPSQYSQRILNPLHCSWNAINEENEHGRGQSSISVPHRALARVWWFHLPGVTIVPRGTSKCQWVSDDSLANNELPAI